MKKLFASICAILALLSLAACSKQEKKTPVDASPAEIERAVAQALGEEAYLCTVEVSGDELFTTVLGDFDMDKIDSFVVRQSAVTALFPDTVVVVKCKDGYENEAVKLINQRYANIVSYSRLYSFSVPKVTGARLYKNGSTVAFIIAGAPAGPEMSVTDEYDLAAAEYKKIDEAMKPFFGELENLAEKIESHVEK